MKLAFGFILKHVPDGTFGYFDAHEIGTLLDQLETVC